MKLTQLTFTRFLAAMAIVLFHNRGRAFPFSCQTAQYFVPYLNCLVSYFFVLSGFILVISTHKDNKLFFERKAFWFNRFSRIYPLYFFALIMFLVLTLAAHSPNIYLTGTQFGLTATLTQSWIPKYTLAYNFPSWSLSVEAFFYLCFPFLVQAFDKLAFNKLIFTGILIWIISLIALIILVNVGVNSNLAAYFPLLHLNEFILGICTGYLFIRKHEYLIKNRKIFYAAFSIGFLALAVLILNQIPFLEHYYHDGLLAPLFALFIICISINDGIIKKIFSKRFAVYLGEISYGIYILQIPFYILITGINKRTFHFKYSAQFYIYIIGLIIFSAICFEVIETPSRRWLRKMYNKKI